MSSTFASNAPMHLTLIREPFHRDGGIYEEKYDGWRIVASKDDKGVRLISRNGRDHTTRFADIAHTVAKLAADAALVSRQYGRRSWHQATAVSVPQSGRVPIVGRLAEQDGVSHATV